MAAGRSMLFLIYNGSDMKSLIIVCTFSAVIPAKAGIQLTTNGCPTEELGHDAKGENL